MEISQATIDALLYNNEPAYQSPAYRRCCAMIHWNGIQKARAIRPLWIKTLAKIDIQDEDEAIRKAKFIIKRFKSMPRHHQTVSERIYEYREAQRTLVAARYQRRQMFKLSQLMAAE